MKKLFLVCMMLTGCVQPCTELCAKAVDMYDFCNFKKFEDGERDQYMQECLDAVEEQERLDGRSYDEECSKVGSQVHIYNCQDFTSFLWEIK